MESELNTPKYITFIYFGKLYNYIKGRLDKFEAVRGEKISRSYPMVNVAMVVINQVIKHEHREIQS